MSRRHSQAHFPWTAWLLLTGCAAPRGIAAPPTGASVAPTAAEAAGPTRATPTASPASSAAHAVPLPGGEEPTPSKALPELRVEAMGMHVGGGKNDPEEKAPFHRALERQFPAFLDCYRMSEAPLAGGNFGIDIKIPHVGGHPTLTQPRTKMRGAAFQECMVNALGRTKFERPKAGPTVISYSVRFTLGK